MIMLIVCVWLGQTATFIFGSPSYKAQTSLQSVHTEYLYLKLTYQKVHENDGYSKYEDG